jgi:hypothetical protein
MPTTEEKPSDDVEKVLSDLKSIEDRKQALIDDLLRQKADAMKAFDEKLLKLGWKPDSTGKPKKSHHKAPAASGPAKPKTPAAPAAGPVSGPSKTKRKA